MAKKEIMSYEQMMLQLAADIGIGIKKPNMLSYRPHGKQVPFHQSRKKGRQFLGANRSGKTTAGVVEDLLWLTGKHPYIRTPEPPIFGRLVTVDFKQGVNQIILPVLQQWVPKSFLINGSWEDSYNSNEALLRLSNGSQLQIMTYEQKLESFAGVPRHFVHFDEEPPKAIFEECKLRLVDYNGRWWITETPVAGMTWTYEEVYLKAKAGDPLIDVFEVQIWDNTYLPEESIEDVLSGLDEETKKIRGSGRYVAVGGAIFPTFSEENNVIKCYDEDSGALKEWIPPKDWSIYESMDHGLNNQTAWLWHAVSPDGTIVTFDEHYKRGMVVADHAVEVLAREEKWRKFGHVPYLRIGDPAIQQRSGETGRSIRIAYADKGLNIVLANNEVKGGLDKMNEYFKQKKWFICSNCTNLLKEIPMYRWKPYDSPKTADKSNPREEPQKKNDHAIDSSRYFFSFMPELKPIKNSSKKGLTPDDVARMMGATTTFDPSRPYQTDPEFDKKSNEIYIIDETVGEY